MTLSYKQQFNKKYKQVQSQPNSIADIAKLTGYKKAGLQTIFNKGIGAFKNNRGAVRPSVKSPEQWGYARVYAAVNPKSSAYKIDKIHLKR